MAGIDDETGEPLVQREDDNEAIVEARLKVYYEKTLSLVNFYRELALKGSTVHFHVVFGLCEPRLVSAKIFDCLDGTMH